MSTIYEIVDEPNPKRHQALIVNPLVIFFAAILAQVVFSLPFASDYWLPFAWLVLNGFLLGSPTRWKEAVIAVTTILGLIALFFLMGYLLSTSEVAGLDPIPYIRIAIQSVMYFSLYLIVFMQARPYQIYEYLRDMQRERV